MTTEQPAALPWPFNAFPEDSSTWASCIDGVRQLHAEVEALKREDAYMALKANNDLLRTEVEALRKDAARYRWLRKNPQWLGWEHDFREDEVEREIDAAMKEQP